MENLEIKPVRSQDEIKQAALLAKEIWEDHFTPIIGVEQVAYMLHNFQSEKAIGEMIAKGYEYFFFVYDGVTVGYMAFEVQRNETPSLFLSKLYIKKEYRGRKIARKAIEFLCDICLENKLPEIWLTCNRHNDHSIAAYRRMGFTVAYEQDADIGNGFFMNDYIMKKIV